MVELSIIEIGKTVATMMNPPNEGIVRDSSGDWKIGRNYQGMIVLRKLPTECHPDFLNGMDMHQFVCWINQVGGV